MAHFAIIKDNIVQQVVVVSNDKITENGVEIEQKGIDFLKKIIGENFEYKQTSYNHNLRKNYAGIGYTYDSQRDAFIAPKPGAEYVLNEETCRWELIKKI